MYVRVFIFALMMLWPAHDWVGVVYGRELNTVAPLPGLHYADSPNGHLQCEMAAAASLICFSFVCADGRKWRHVVHPFRTVCGSDCMICKDKLSIDSCSADIFPDRGLKYKPTHLYSLGPLPPSPSLTAMLSFHIVLIRDSIC